MKRIDKMKIVAFAHMGVPEHNAGSEVALFAILRGMAARGHSVRAIADEISRDYDLDGVKVMRIPERVDKQFWVRDHFDWADIGITHLNMTSSAMRAAKDTAKPLVHYVHNHNQLKFHNVRAVRAQLLMFNSQWVYERNLADGIELGPSIVVHPIVEPERYRGPRGEWTTLVSLTRSKGSEVFYELAKRMQSEGIKFLGVKSCYGEPHVDESLPNVFIAEHSPDIDKAYSRTKVILMPSDYESYGRVAVEGACRGIPSIVHPTPGLKEALGDAAIYCDRTDVDAWQVELSRLYKDEAYYAERSAAAQAFADTLDPEGELNRVEAALKAVARFGVEGSEQTVEALGEIEYCRRAKEGGYFDPARESASYRPPLGGHVSRQPYIAPHRLWMNERGDGLLPDHSPGRAYLFAAPGQEIPYDQALALGLIELEVEEGKMISGPQENKAILSPSENKAIQGPAENKVQSAVCAQCGTSGVELRNRLCEGCRAEAEIESNGITQPDDGLVTSAKLSAAGMIQPGRLAA